MANWDLIGSTSLADALSRGAPRDATTQWWNTYGKQAAATTGPKWNDISGYFGQALSGLTGEVEKMYQSGKRRAMGDIAMQSVNAGMANTLNLPSADIAYDEANRPATNLGLAQTKASIVTDLGKTAAGIYGENLGAQTSRYGIDMGAATARSNASLDYQSSAANRAWQQYLGELELKYKASGQGGFAPGATTYTGPVTQSNLFG